MEQYKATIKIIYGLALSAVLSGMLCLMVQYDSKGLTSRTEQAEKKEMKLMQQLVVLNKK